MGTRRLALFLAGLVLSCAIAFSQVPSDPEIRRILADRVGAEDNGTGIVVGVVDAAGRRLVSYGSLAKNDKRKLDGDTVFEIGSMTKVFTSLVLMDMVRRGEVALTDPISKYLPETVKVPERNGRKITLADLFKFEHGTTEWRIMLGTDGKAVSIGFRHIWKVLLGVLSGAPPWRNAAVAISDYGATVITPNNPLA